MLPTGVHGQWRWPHPGRRSFLTRLQACGARLDRTWHIEFSMLEIAVTYNGQSLMVPENSRRFAHRDTGWHRSIIEHMGWHYTENEIPAIPCRIYRLFIAMTCSMAWLLSFKAALDRIGNLRLSRSLQWAFPRKNRSAMKASLMPVLIPALSARPMSWPLINRAASCPGRRTAGRPAA